MVNADLFDPLSPTPLPTGEGLLRLPWREGSAAYGAPNPLLVAMFSFKL